MFSKKFFFWFLVTLSFSIYLTLESVKSLSAVGARIQGDELIIKDSLNSPISKKPRNHTIQFEYPIVNKVISYIELRSNSNAAIQFTINVDEKNKGGMLIGSATAILSKDFHLDICIFGFNSSDKPETFKPILRPELSLTGEIKPQIADTSEDPYEDHNDFEYDYDPRYDAKDNDEHLEYCKRQAGDYLLYEKVEHMNTDIKQDQRLTFYYVDSDYITCAKITARKTRSSSVIYSEVTDHSLKAIIEDKHVYSLTAEFQVYGFRPEDKPIDYIPVIAKPHHEFSLKHHENQENHCECSGSSNLRYSNIYILSILPILLAFVQ